MGITDSTRKLIQKMTSIGKNREKQIAESGGVYDYSKTPVGGGKTSNVPKQIEKSREKEEEKLQRRAFKEEEKIAGKASEKSHTGAIITLVILGVIGGIIYLYFANATVHSLVTNVLAPLQPAITALQNSGQLVGCMASSSGFYKLGSPSSIGTDSGAANAFDLGYLYNLCQQDIQGARESGCTECFDMSVEPLNPRIVAGSGQSAIYSLVIKATDDQVSYSDLSGKQATQPLPSAANPIITLTSGTVIAKLSPTLNIGCASFQDGIKCSELDPGILKTLPLVVTGEIAGPTCDGKTNAIDADATLEYTYRSQGSAPINIRRVVGGKPVDGPFQNLGNPITLAGPVKIDIIPDSEYGTGSYNAGQSNLAFVYVKFRNNGAGQARISSIHLEQITPEGAQPLNVLNCYGPVNLPNVDQSKGTIDMDVNGLTLDPNSRTGGVVCNFELPKSVSTDFTTYIVTGSATYDYLLKKQASSIIVDQSACTSTSQSSQGTTPTVPSGGSTSGGSSGQCLAANEDKVCPSGMTFQDDGCCR